MLSPHLARHDDGRHQSLFSLLFGACFQVESERLSRLVGIVNRLRPKFLLVTGNITASSPGSAAYEDQASFFFVSG